MKPSDEKWIAESLCFIGGADRERGIGALLLAKAGDGVLGVVRDGILCEVHELAHLAGYLNYFSVPFT